MVVNGFHLLTIITKTSTFDVAAVLDPPLFRISSVVTSTLLRENSRKLSFFFHGWLDVVIQVHNEYTTKSKVITYIVLPAN